jgi:hypothetical protein
MVQFYITGVPAAWTIEVKDQWVSVMDPPVPHQGAALILPSAKSLALSFHTLQLLSHPTAGSQMGSYLECTRMKKQSNF